jgi:hypothetical protein
VLVGIADEFWMLSVLVGIADEFWMLSVLVGITDAAWDASGLIVVAVADGVCIDDIGTGITDTSLTIGLLTGETAVINVEPEALARVPLAPPIPTGVAVVVVVVTLLLPGVITSPTLVQNP